MLHRRNITRRHQLGPTETMVLNNLHLHVREPEFCSIMCPSGSGRSTLLNNIVEIGGIAPEKRRLLAVGMSANLAIITHDNPAAVVLTPHAVHEGPQGRLVRVRKVAGLSEVPVVIGIATPDGVEQGGALNAGDVIMLGSAP